MKTITDIIHYLIEKWYDEENLDPFHINCGSCEEFMLDVIEMSKDVLGLSLDEGATPWENGEGEYDNYPGHYWVEYEGKCYDSECADGVDDWKELPIFKKYRFMIKNKDLITFPT